MDNIAADPINSPPTRVRKKQWDLVPLEDLKVACHGSVHFAMRLMKSVRFISIIGKYPERFCSQECSAEAKLPSGIARGENLNQGSQPEEGGNKAPAIFSRASFRQWDWTYWMVFLRNSCVSCSVALKVGSVPGGVGTW